MRLSGITSNSAINFSGRSAHGGNSRGNIHNIAPAPIQRTAIIAAREESGGLLKKIGHEVKRFVEIVCSP